MLRHIHGLSPFPGAWCEMPIDGEQARIKILRCELAKGSGAPGELLDDHLTIACGDGAIRILELQRAGKAPMKAEDFLRGTPLKPPARLQLMPRYKLIIEYDGTPFSRLADPGQRRRRCRARWKPRSRRSAASRFASTARAAPMPACMRWRRSRIAISQSHFCRAVCATG